MKTLCKYARLFGLYFKVNLAAALEYRASFLLQAFGVALSNGSFVFFWWVAFAQIGNSIGGYSFNDVMFIWAVTSTGFGIAHILFANINHLTRLIVTGELDTYLLQPKSVLMSLLCARTSLGAWGDFFYGFILIALTQGGSANVWLMFLLGSLLSTLLMTAVSITAHTLTFYLGDASQIAGMGVEFIINFNIYPMGIFPVVIRILMYSLIPAAFMVHIPLQLARQFNPLLLIVLLLVTTLYCALSGWFFYRGLKRYESDNLITHRL